MKKTLSIISIVLIILLSACNDDYLDRFPETSIGVENFFNTEEDLKLYTYNFYDFPGFSEAFEDANGTDNGANTSNYELKNIMVAASPSSSTVTVGWDNSDWSKLRSINLYLDNSGKADVSDEVRANYDGIARFFRAKFYMDKVKRFSDIPWYDTEIGTNDESLLYKGRDSRDVVVQNIFADYVYAASNVKGDKVPGAVNKWVVLAYQSRHALYEGTFRKYHDELGLESTANVYLQMARDAAKEIMDNGGFSIYNTGNPASDYASIFSSLDLTTNSEVILATIGEYNVADHDQQFHYNLVNFGDFDRSPSRNLMQDYLMKDGTPYTQQADYETKVFTEEFVDRDPRLMQTFAYPGWSNYIHPNGYVQQLNKNFTGYHNIKGWINTGERSVWTNADYAVLRYAEILLTYAEARAELGELTQDDLDKTINVLRDRAGMPHLMMSPSIDPVQETKYSNVNSGQKAEILEIRRERRIEMAWEGLRYDDLMRWKLGKLIENEPKGMYFPSLGKYDLTGDGIEDIILIDAGEAVPDPADKEANSLGVTLIYYRAGSVGEDASIWLSDGNSGTLVSDVDRGTFVEPKYYYRPVPETEVQLNPNLLPQIFGWD